MTTTKMRNKEELNRRMKVFRFFTGWKAEGDLAGIPKSIIIVAPHTSYWDAILGKCFLMATGTHYNFITKRSFFRFPVKYILRALGFVPVGGIKGHNTINDVCEIMQNSESRHIVICPEGGFAPTERWNPGFYYMAKRAHVPIVVAFLDYKNRECGIKGVITDLSDLNTVFEQIAHFYEGVSARHPENFRLPKISH